MKGKVSEHQTTDRNLQITRFSDDTDNPFYRTDTHRLLVDKPREKLDEITVLTFGKIFIKYTFF